MDEREKAISENSLLELLKRYEEQRFNAQNHAMEFRVIPTFYDNKESETDFSPSHHNHIAILSIY